MVKDGSVALNLNRSNDLLSIKKSNITKLDNVRKLFLKCDRGITKAFNHFTDFNSYRSI
jgi:hypothetical protein